MADLHINNNKGWSYKWSDEEDNLIKKYYPLNGASEVKKFLDNREIKSIQQRAQKLGVKFLTYNKEYFDIIDCSTKAYWLGFLYADGYVTTGNRWGLELCIEDLNHMQNLLNEIEYIGNVKTRERNNNKSCLFQINNLHMTNSLIDKGVIHNKTYELKFPSMEILNEVYYPDFIRGFFDGDGCIFYKYNTKPRKDRNNRIQTRLSKEVNIVCKSDDFVDNIFNVLIKENINMNKSLNKRDNLNVLRISKIEEIKKFYNYIYKNSTPKNRLERKYNKFNELFIATSSSDVSIKIS